MLKVPILLFALLLLSASPISLWSQQLTVFVTDQNGIPVKNAEISVAYQRDSPGEKDGFSQGMTGSEGTCSVSLLNNLPPEQEDRVYSVHVKTFYWVGETTFVEADNLGQKTLPFSIPFIQERVTVRAIPPEYLSGGATVEAYGTPIVEQIGEGGVAFLAVPQGLEFSGYIVSGGKRKLFYSQNSTPNPLGWRTIDVWLPESWKIGPSQIPPGARPITLQLAIVKNSGEAFAGENVVYSYGDFSRIASTDSSGVAVIDAYAGVPINVTLASGGRPHTLFYTANESGQGTLRIPPPLALQPLSAVSEGKNCYRVIANVIGVSGELQVAFTMRSQSETAALQPSNEGGGIYSAQACISSDSTVGVSASDQYGIVETSMDIAYSGSQAEAQGGSKPPDNSFLWAILAMLLAAIAGAIFFAKRQLGASFSFVMDYVRIIYSIFQQKRRPTPESAVGGEREAPKGLLSSLISMILPRSKKKPFLGGDESGKSLPPQQFQQPRQPAAQQPENPPQNPPPAQQEPPPGKQPPSQPAE